MKEIEGIVCTAKSVIPIKQEQLFGPNTGKSDFSHQTFRSNGLVPFNDVSTAQEALKDLKKRKNLYITKAGLAEIKLKIVTSDDEIEQFRKNKNLILIGDLDFGIKILLGRKIENVPGVCYAPVSDLEMNGFKTIKKFEYAAGSLTGALYEVKRQGHFTASLATFDLKRLK